MAQQSKHKILKIVLGVIAGVLGLLLLTYGVLMYFIPAVERVDDKAVEGSSDWMAALADETPLSKVVLPGTHDSASFAPQLAFFSKCQNLTIEEQLNAGFRFLDIRLAVSGENLCLKHGFTNCKTGWWPFAPTLYLDAVLDQCKSFLEAHPTETILFAVKKEQGSETTAEFQSAVDAILVKYSSMLLAVDHIPTVGEARGKLILLRRYADANSVGAGAGISFQWNESAYAQDQSTATCRADNGFYTLWVQDRYKLGVEEKWEAFRQGLDEGHTGENELSVNYLSTNGPPAFGHPYKYASALNDLLLSYDGTLHGWVIVDFGTPTLAALIYNKNF